MKTFSTRLRDSIRDARDFAGKADFVTLSPDERELAVREAQQLLDKLDAAAQRYLVVGLLGGTGVGKSTLMNALAGAPISSASHRRPHTDAILLYRHADAPLPFDPAPEITWKEFIHTGDAVREIILCDLPDYDSLLSEHRQQVLGFVEHIDILVWLTSPEKYADGSFYEFLSLVPKSRHNFYFVVNKIDLLFDGASTEEGYEKMRRIHADFQGHLRRVDIATPTIYLLSAAEVCAESAISPWNQFPVLRQEIFRQRDEKEIQSIKTANLDTEYTRYLALFANELAHLETMHDILTGTIRQIEEGNDEDRTFIQETVHAVMDGSVRAEIRSQIENISALTGPGYGVAALLQHWKYRGGQSRNEDGKSTTFGLAVERTVRVLQRRIEHITNGIVSGIMRRGAHRAMIGQVEEVLQQQQQKETLPETLGRTVSGRIDSAHRDRHRLFRTGQYAVYFFLLITLIAALAGKEAWQDFYAHPTAASLMNFAFTAFYTLFSPGGLAALGSYTLINLFFGLWFYRRYRALRERKMDAIINSFVKDVGILWQETLDRITAALKEYDRTLGLKARSLKGLKPDPK
ncbi:MAG: 50S ribosome-binding GTPase [Deltaproteobacteria bacterium]|nr:50S ribosome-binding GTPase [Deltaproteobacteria bacterium]